VREFRIARQAHYADTPKIQPVRPAEPALSPTNPLPLAWLDDGENHYQKKQGIS
jgi:hypothetical protein